MQNIKKIKWSILFLSLSIISCEKENKENEISSKDNSIYSKISIEQESGILKFSNHEEMYSKINALASLDMDERIMWGNLNGIKTQQIIYEEACKEQERFAKENYSEEYLDMSNVELESLGIKPTFCEFVNTYSSIGILKKQTEEDGSLSFDNVIQDKGLLYVINEQSLIIVGNELYHISNDKIKTIPYNENTLERDKQDLILANENDDTKKIKVIDLSERSASITIGDIFNQNSNSWVWYHNSSTERFNHYVFIHSYYISSPEGIYSEYYTTSKAQKKILGVWVKTSGYKPINYVGGSWNWRTTILTYYPNPPSWMFQTGNTSSYYENFGGSNEIFEYLFPTGNSANVTPTPPNVATNEEVDIYNMHVYGSFAGGCCGYSTNYYH